MSKVVIGFDPGFGYIKYAYRKNGKMEMGKFPSVVAKTKNPAPDLHYYKDYYYYVGENARLQAKEEIEEVKDYANLKKYIPVLLAEVFKRTGIGIGSKFKKVEIVTGLSLAHKEDSDNFKNVLSKFNVSNIPYNLNVKLLPQGFGAMTALMNVKETANDVNYVIVDNGFNTLDVVIVIDSQPRMDRLAGYEGRGVISIAEQMKNYIHREFKRDISVKEAAAVVDSQTYKLRGEVHDLSDVVSEFKSEYTKNLMDFLEKNYSNEIDKFDKIYFVGGGAYFIDPDYASNIKIVKYPEYYNAIGNLVFGEKGGYKGVPNS